MKKPKLRCYVCGGDISEEWVGLVSATPNETDRVFVVHGGDCLADIQEDQPSLLVKIEAAKE